MGNTAGGEQVAGTFRITPNLLLGDVPDDVFCFPAASASTAVALIRLGVPALLPASAWDQAADVLVAFGLSAEEAQRRIRVVAVV